MNKFIGGIIIGMIMFVVVYDAIFIAMMNQF